MNQNHFEHNSNYSGFDQPPQYFINHPEDLNQQRISDVHVIWDKLEESNNEILNMVRSFCEMVIQRKQAANISTYTPEPSRHFNFTWDDDDDDEEWDKLEDSYNEIFNMVQSFCEMVIQRKQASINSTYTPEPSRHFNFTCDDDDDDEEYSIPLKDMPQISPSIALAPVSSIMEPEDSLTIGDEHLSTISEKESDEFIKSSVEDLVLIPSESEDTSGSDSESVLHSSDDFSPIFEEKSVTFSNPLFDSNDDFTSNDDESLSDEDVPKDVKIYSNPLFEFDDEYISSDVNLLFDVVLKDIECKVSYDSNLDESTFLVTPLSDSNEDECLALGDDIELLLHHDPSTPIISVVSILEGFIDEPPLKENDDLFDLESKENDWKKILYDAPIDDLITEDKVFDPGIYEKSFSLTFVKLTFEDRHYLPITFVIRIFLPYLTYSVDSPFLFSSRSEDTIFNPGISTFHFSSLKPVAYENPMVIFLFFCFCPKDKGIQGEIPQDREDPCLFSILQSSGF
ncbi:hypothetical protein Tco_1088860 [Tanacetum coccineum]